MYISYSRPAIAYYVLKDILGANLFQECLVEFIDRWNGKHPTAYDFFYTFEDVSGQELSWFWNPWFFDFGYPDLAIAHVSKGDIGYSIIVERVGDFPAPIKLIISYEDGTTEDISESAKIWETGSRKANLFVYSKKKMRQVEVNSNLVPDNNHSNNVFVLNP